MLEIRDIHTYYGFSYVLQGVSLKINSSSIVGMIGRNGAGKTTLIRSIIGLTPARRGQILFAGRDITHLRPNLIARMGIGLVPQGRRVFPSLSVKENLMASAMKRGKGWTLDRIYDLFPLLQERKDQKAGRLSGGEQQILAIARGLRCEPDLMLMDEPSEGLAPFVVKELGVLILRLKNEGLSILLVEQDLSLALEVSDYVYIMSKGTIVHESTPRDLLQQKEVLMQRYLGM